MGQNGQDARRLGKHELGRHAFEQHMPDRVANVIKNESTENKTSRVIPRLAELLESDHEVDAAYLCRSDITQVSKLPGEGNHFCGYRNIQMLLPESHAINSIPALQEMIEKGWDQGLNSHGRVETGGIIGTRKHIGTSEAQVLLRSLSIPCKAAAFEGDKAWFQLLDSIEAYFTAHLSAPSTSDRIRITTRNPIFLQRPSHSLTVIGIERDQKGKRQLLVFDPAYQPPSAMKKSSLLPKSALLRRLILYQYRRNERYLKRYNAFETLYLIDAS